MEPSSFGRLITVLTSPGKTFQSISERPTWVIPVLVLTVLGLVTSLLAVPKIDWAEVARQQMEESGGELTAEQEEQQIELVEKISGITVYAFAVIGPWLLFPLLALVFLGALRIAGSEISFVKSLAVIVHGWLPWGVSSLLSIPVILSRTELANEQLQSGILVSNLSFLAGDDPSPALEALLVNIDFFSFWVLALLVIGYRIVGKVSTTASASVTLGLWAVWVVGRVALAALFG